MDTRLNELVRAKDKEEHEKRLREISNNERLVKKDPMDISGWLSLPSLYFQEQRYKDMENALKMCLKADVAKNKESWLWYMYLGRFYLAALSVSVRGKCIGILGRVPTSSVIVDNLGYSTERLRELAKENLSAAYEAYNKTSFEDKVPTLKELELALKAAETTSGETFKEFDLYYEHMKH